MRLPKDETGIITVVAKNVRALREAAGLSQEELAFEAGVDRTYISQIERRQKNITITVLAKIAAALRRRPEELVAKLGRRSGRPA
jgi:transcriptional regulator with XRE-family HTH domain